MFLHLTQDDMNNSRHYVRGAGCIVEVAAQRQFGGGDWVATGGDWYATYESLNGYDGAGRFRRFMISDALDKAMTDFDAELDVQPGAYEIQETE